MPLAVFVQTSFEVLAKFLSRKASRYAFLLVGAVSVPGRNRMEKEVEGTGDV